MFLCPYLAGGASHFFTLFTETIFLLERIITLSIYTHLTESHAKEEMKKLNAPKNNIVKFA